MTSQLQNPKSIVNHSLNITLIRKKKNMKMRNQEKKIMRTNILKDFMLRKVTKKLPTVTHNQ